MSSDQVQREASEGKRGLSASLALFWVGFVCSAPLSISPLILGGLIDTYHYTAREAGFIAGVETLGLGVASLLVSSVGVHWSRHTTIRWGTTFALLATLTPFVSHYFVAVFLLRALSGLGCGMIAAAVLAAIAQMPRPDRQFGLYFIMSYLLSAVFFPASSAVIASLKFASLFYLLALVLLTAFAALRWIPRGPIAKPNASGKLPPFPFYPAAVSLAVSFFFWVGDGAVWSFSERLGLRSGVTPLQVGAVLAIGQLASMAGAGAAALIDTRFGRLLPTAVAIILSMLGSLLFLVLKPTAYCAAILAISFAWTLFLTYLNGLMSAQDPAGRVAALSVTSQTAGMAVGPSLGGVLVVTYGYSSVTTLGMVAYGISISVLLLLVFLSRSAVRWFEPKRVTR